MNRGDRREDIFHDDKDRESFLATLGEVCLKADWLVHACCLMGNHLHLVVETPQGNLIAGMKWFLGTYTARFNRRHKLFGHLFSGRYKALVVDAASPGAGNIETPGAVDEYTFTGTAGQRVYLQRLTDFDAGTHRVLYNPDGTKLHDGLLSGDSGTLTLEQTGTYTIKVWHDGFATGTYRFKLNGMRPPVAGDDFAATTVNRSVDLPVSRLLANDSDPDTDPLTLSLPTGATAQGGTVVMVGSSVRYTPPPDFAGTDTFTYEADDGWEHRDTATVTVSVRRPETLGLNTISAARNPDGSIVLKMAGIAGQSYQLWYAPDVALGPWALLDTVVADVHGIVSYTDMSAIGVPARFYRLAETAP